MSQRRLNIRILLLLVCFSIFTFQAVSAQDDPLTVHKAAVQQIYDDVFIAGNLDLMDTVYAADYVNHGFGDDLTRDDFKANVAAMRAALPDFAVTVEVLIAENDWAASRVIFSGTFENEWVMADQTIAPTGEPVSWALNVLHRFNDEGQIVEDFTAFDSLGLLIQLKASSLPPLLANLMAPAVISPIVVADPPIAPDANNVHKETFMHIIDDAINHGDLTAIDNYMAEDHIAHESFGDYSRAQFREIIAVFRATVPDLVATPEYVVAEGDWLAARIVYEGTFSNPLSYGTSVVVPATNEPIKLILNVFVRFNEDGIGIEDFKEYNRLAWLRQVGLLPAETP